MGVLSRRAQLPNFLILGAQRCGTTSLFGSLSAHPDVAARAEGEVHFFDLNYRRGLGWYRRHFRRDRGEVSGESSPYYLYHPDVPGRVVADLPDAKLIVLLRDPVQRAWSQHCLNVATGRETLGFLAALEAEEERLDAAVVPDRAQHILAHRDFAYAARSNYLPQLERWVDAVGVDRLLMVSSHRLFDEPTQTHRLILDHLGLRSFELPTFHRNHSDNELDGATARSASVWFEPVEDELDKRYGFTFAEGRKL